MSVLADQLAMLRQAAPVEVSGKVAEVRGLAIRVNDLPAPVGALVHVHTGGPRGTVAPGEVVGFDEAQTIVMPFGRTEGVSRGNRVTAVDHAQLVRVGPSLLGRVMNAMGEPIDGKGDLNASGARPLHPEPLDALDRPLIDEPLAVGVRAIDSMMSIGRGQRIGVFAQPGLGKSTLLGMMARRTTADVSVVALVGERGREVRDFVVNHLGDEGLSRAVVVAATGDEPPLMRIRAAHAATAVAEHFRDQGLDVLLIMDSVTRLCQAQRQVGLSAGEPPATRGYPPSVFSMLPMLLERSGRTASGSITGFYAVLVEGDEETDPIADSARGVLDGHIQLSRTLANKGHWPAIDVLSSISRVADDVTSDAHRAARAAVIEVCAAYREVEDLVNIGAYAMGSNPQFDLAIAVKPVLDEFFRQGRGKTRTAGASGSGGEGDPFELTSRQLIALAGRIADARKQIASASRDGRSTGRASGPGE